VLNKEEKDLGAALIDFGGGTTDLAIFKDKGIKHTAVIALGGNNLTTDISVGLRTPMAEAEKIKVKYATCLTSRVGKDETIEVPGIGGREPRTLSRQILAEILEPRVEEIFDHINREVYRARMEDLITSGVVITGGSCLLEGVLDIAESVFALPTRIGKPMGIRGLVDVVNNPMYATAVGLVLYGSRCQPKKKFRIRDKNIFNRVMARMRKWFKEII
jgi:cell division protein FtsA